MAVTGWIRRWRADNGGVAARTRLLRGELGWLSVPGMGVLLQSARVGADVDNRARFVVHVAPALARDRIEGSSTMMGEAARRVSRETTVYLLEWLLCVADALSQREQRELTVVEVVVSGSSGQHAPRGAGRAPGARRGCGGGRRRRRRKRTTTTTTTRTPRTKRRPSRARAAATPTSTSTGPPLRRSPAAKGQEPQECQVQGAVAAHEPTDEQQGRPVCGRFDRGLLQAGQWGKQVNPLDPIPPKGNIVVSPTRQLVPFFRRANCAPLLWSSGEQQE